MEAIRPSVTVLYDGKDISSDLSPGLISVEYTDNSEGVSDEVMIAVEDTAGLWRNGWYPDKGATLELTFSLGALSLPCGEFEIDEVEFTGPPDTVQIRALAAGVKKAFRTKQTRAYENVTLKDIASKVAAAYSLTLSGEIAPINIKHKLQHRTRDLTFLKELALEYGYTFAVRGKKLVFTALDSIESTPGVAILDVTDVTRYQFRDKMLETFKDAKAKYHNPQTNEVVEGEQSASVKDVSGDTLEIRTKSEDATQAKAKAKAALHQANSKKVEGSLSLPGNPQLMAGLNLTLTGFGGKLSGKYHILRSRHTISRGAGYMTEIEVKQL